MKKIFFLSAIFFFFLIPSFSFAQHATTLEFYYGATCPHCKNEKKWFPELKKLYPSLQIKEYEVWFDASGKKIFSERMKELGESPSGVPVNVIGKDIVVGFDSQKILETLEKNYGPPAKIHKKTNSPQTPELWKKFLSSSWPVMAFMLGLLDGFNPCAMWTLFILLGFLLSMEDKKKRWIIGTVFVGTSALIYFGALLFYLLGFQGISEFVAGPIMTWIFRAVGLMALGAGALAIKSYRTMGIECEVRDPESRKKFHEKLSDILNRDQFWFVLLGITALAFSVNMVELLCSFAIPTSFTATLVGMNNSFATNLLALLIYDIAYIFDDVLVLVIALWTMNLKIISPKVVQYSHLAGGILLLLLGALLVFDPSIMGNLR